MHCIAYKPQYRGAQSQASNIYLLYLFSFRVPFMMPLPKFSVFNSWSHRSKQIPKKSPYSPKPVVLGIHIVICRGTQTHDVRVLRHSLCDLRDTLHFSTWACGARSRPWYTHSGRYNSCISKCYGFLELDSFLLCDILQSHCPIAHPHIAHIASIPYPWKERHAREMAPNPTVLPNKQPVYTL